MRTRTGRQLQRSYPNRYVDRDSNPISTVFGIFVLAVTAAVLMNAVWGTASINPAVPEFGSSEGLDHRAQRDSGK